MDKVKLPRDVAEAIEWQRKSVAPTNYDIIKYSITGEGNLEIKEFAEVNFDELLQALVNGYEVEETPEDMFREYIKTIPSTHLETAIKVIDIFNIKIEGIN